MSHENTTNTPPQSLPEPPAQPAAEAAAGNLPKAYDPSIIERRWAEYWVRERLFDVPTPATKPGSPSMERSDMGGKSKENFTLLLPPPNVTGRLHMGHMLNQTEMDILTRWHRMRGERSLWVPGTDHAGIATQMMVERQLAAEGTNRKTLGREAFNARVWEWKSQYGSAITDQMRRLGASVDWSREYFTMDDRLSVAVKEAFVRLYEQGLIYRGSYIVNWDPIQQTAVSDLEVTHEDRLGKLYHIRYPFADGTGSIVVATTRPETMLGDTAVAVNPNDERYAAFIGKLISLPLSGVSGGPNREIPILADDWAQPEFGTGAVKVTPAHDPNDFALGQRHSLPSLTILDETAHVALPGSPYHGLDRFAARKRIVADLEAAGLLVDARDHSLAIALSQRSGAVIEPRLSMQWFLAVNKPVSETRPSVAQTAIDAVRDGHIKFTPEMYQKIYMEWMTNIHDWCISRQLWWGHRIPAWHCTACRAITVAHETPTACATCGAVDITQETDVLDTWFSSGLLPFTVFGWPGTQEPKATETIRKSAEAEGKYIRQVGGTGNYGHVKLRVSPNEAGKGFAFSNETAPHTLPERFIQPIREGIQEALRGGVVEGHPLVDITVALFDGSYHETDSNEMAFRIAASIALKEAARKAQPVVLDRASNLEPTHLRSHGNLLTLEPTPNLEPRTSNLTPDLAAFYPTSLLVTGFDILFFWVARMIMFGTHFMLDVPMPDGSSHTLAGAVPFKEVYIHALVRDADRQKMSKTKGNVIDPIEIIERFGTDAVRFTLASMASPGTDIAFSEARTEGNRAFANKIWNAARFLFMNLDRAREAGIPVDRILRTSVILSRAAQRAGFISGADQGTPSLSSETWEDVPQTPLESSWILARLSQTAAAVNASLAEYRFDEAANHVYQFFWGDLCDWYLEIVKLRLNFGEADDKTAAAAALATLFHVFESALRLLSPFMPFLTEEIWHALYAGAPPAKSIALTSYPQASDYPSDEAAIVEMRDLQFLTTELRAIRKDLSIPEGQTFPGYVLGVNMGDAKTGILRTPGDLLSAHSDILGRLTRVSPIQEVGAQERYGSLSSLSWRQGLFEVALQYHKKIDVPAERERLTKDLAKYEKGLAAAERQLSNDSFMSKAPAHIVEGLRKQAAETRTVYDKTKAALDALPPNN
ncbi:MAG: valine--tRNA ligase [Acidobacteriaceae bacterium]|jgi:valyl-tRNA synthetase